MVHLSVTTFVVWLSVNSETLQVKFDHILIQGSDKKLMEIH